MIWHYGAVITAADNWRNFQQRKAHGLTLASGLKVRQMEQLSAGDLQTLCNDSVPTGGADCHQARHYDRARWRELAANAWSDPGWGAAAVEYRRALRHRHRMVEPQRLAQLHRLMADDISLDRAWREINNPGATPQTTADALLYQLRTGGLAAFECPSCRRRLADLSAEQLREVIAALIRVRPRCAAVTDELLIALDEIRR